MVLDDQFCETATSGFVVADIEIPMELTHQTPLTDDVLISYLLPDRCGGIGEFIETIAESIDHMAIDIRIPYQIPCQEVEAIHPDGNISSSLKTPRAMPCNSGSPLGRFVRSQSKALIGYTDHVIRGIFSGSITFSA